MIYTILVCLGVELLFVAHWLYMWGHTMRSYKADGRLAGLPVSFWVLLGLVNIGVVTAALLCKEL